MPLQRNDPAAGQADRVGNIDCFGERFDEQEYIPTENQSQNPVVAIIADRHKLTISHARVVCELLGLGASHG